MLQLTGQKNKGSKGIEGGIEGRTYRVTTLVETTALEQHIALFGTGC